MEQQIHGGNIYDKNIYNKEITLDYATKYHINMITNNKNRYNNNTRY